MAAPWEKYQQSSADEGPWSKYQPKGAESSKEEPSPSFGHTASLIPESFNRGLAQTLDVALNAPTNIANLGVSGAGLAALALNKPELASKLAGYVQQTPNYAQRAFEAIGATHPDITPQSSGERILSSAMQGAGGSLVGPSASLESLARMAAISGGAGGAGQAVTEATDSPLAGQLTSLIAPAALPNSELVAALANRQKVNAARNAITEAGMEKGYVLPPSVNNPTAINRFVESIGGKAATRQAAEMANQPVTNKLVRQQLGLDENAPITESALADLRKTLSDPYKKLSAIPAYREQVSTNAIDPLTNQPVMTSREVNPEQMVEDLKTARADASAWWKAFSRDAHPDTKAKAQEYDAKADNLEQQLDNVALKANKPNLMDDLRDARTRIAQTYSVQKALNIGTTNVSARDLGSALAAGAPFTGNLKLIGQFAEQNPLYTRETSEVSTPGVDALRTGAGAMAAASGKPLAALTTMLGAPARAVALSGPYQRLFAMPNYEPSVLAKALKNYTPFERDLILSRMAGLQAQGQQ